VSPDRLITQTLRRQKSGASTCWGCCQAPLESPSGSQNLPFEALKTYLPWLISKPVRTSLPLGRPGMLYVPMARFRCKAAYSGGVGLTKKPVPHSNPSLSPIRNRISMCQ
jgi:hypothetical protein